jgi:hypothetical protein
VELRKPHTIITGIIITGITALVAPTGTIIALAGRGEVPASSRSAESLLFTVFVALYVVVLIGFALAAILGSVRGDRKLKKLEPRPGDY